MYSRTRKLFLSVSDSDAAAKQSAQQVELFFIEISLFQRLRNVRQNSLALIRMTVVSLDLAFFDILSPFGAELLSKATRDLGSDEPDARKHCIFRRSNDLRGGREYVKSGIACLPRARRHG